MAKPIVKAGDQAQNALDIYKKYWGDTESIADRRRGYAAILLPLASALLVGPYVKFDPDKWFFVLLTIVTSVVGFTIALFWVVIAKRHRGMILYKARWLIVMESNLEISGQIPRWAKVHTFEHAHLYNPKTPKRINFSLSKIEVAGAEILALLFGLSPLVSLGIYWVHCAAYPKYLLAAIWIVGVEIGKFWFEKVKSFDPGKYPFGPQTDLAIEMMVEAYGTSPQAIRATPSAGPASLRHPPTSKR